MVVHNEDPGSSELKIDKNINERIITDRDLILAVESAGGRHIGICMIRCVIDGFPSKLYVKPSVSGFKLEQMLEIEC